jgi:ribosome-binding protein aMBF1 (putative translation factor)
VEQEHQNGHTHLNGFDAISGGAISGGALPGGAIARVAALGSAPLGEATIVNGSSANGAHANGSTSNESTKNGHETNGAAARRSAAPASVALQQVGEARRRQGLSVRCVAQRLNMTIGDVRAQEEPDADMSLSELYRWQSVLEVPLEELLADPQETLSSRVLTRARMLRVMKTAQALVSQARESARRDHAGVEGSRGLADGRASPHGRRDGPDRRTDDSRRLHVRSRLSGAKIAGIASRSNW